MEIYIKSEPKKSFIKESLLELLKKWGRLSSPIKHKTNLKDFLNKKKLLDLCYRITSRDVDEEILKEVISCDEVLVLDTYIRSGAIISIVKLMDINKLITVEQTPTHVSIKERQLYKTKEMNDHNKGEENVSGYGLNVKYLNYRNREKYKLEIIDGKFYRNGRLLSTNKNSKLVHKKYIFVMDQNGIMYSNKHKALKFYHSSFLAGQPVACAGEIEVIGGKLISINNCSGHYTPESEFLKQFIDELIERGVCMEKVDVHIVTE